MPYVSCEYLVPSTGPTQRRFLAARYSVLDPPLRQNAFFVGVLHLPHLRHCVCGLDNCGVCVSPRQDDVHHFRFPLQALHHFRRVEHAIADRIVDLIQHHQIPLPRLDRLLPLRPRLLYHLHIIRIRLLRAHLHKSPSHLLHHKFVPEGFHRIQFPVVPRALQELQHQDSHPLAHRTQSRPHRRSRLAFSRPSVHDDETAAYVSHSRMLDSTRMPPKGGRQPRQALGDEARWVLNQKNANKTPGSPLFHIVPCSFITCDIPLIVSSYDASSKVTDLSTELAHPGLRIGCKQISAPGRLRRSRRDQQLFCVIALRTRGLTCILRPAR